MKAPACPWNLLKHSLSNSLFLPAINHGDSFVLGREKRQIDISMVMKTTCELHSSSHSPSTSSNSPLAVLWFEVINLSIACQWQWSANKFKLTEWSTLLWKKYYCKEIAYTSLTPPPFEMTDNNFCLASVSFWSTNVVPCTIALELIVLSKYNLANCASASIRPWLMAGILNILMS